MKRILLGHDYTCAILILCGESDTIRQIRIERCVYMRKCLRCGSGMKEGCAIKVERAGYGIVLSTDEYKLFGDRIGKPKVAICPECGEVSIYIEDVEKLK